MGWFSKKEKSEPLPIRAVEVEFSRRFVSIFSKHVERIQRTGDRHLVQFAKQYLSPDTVAKLAISVGKKMALSHSDGLEHSFSIGNATALYAASTLPFEYAKASSYFAKQYGGYAEMLGRMIQLPIYQDCQVLCHITYCDPNGGVPWANASILRMPCNDNSQFPSVFAVDLLTEQERRKLAL